MNSTNPTRSCPDHELAKSSMTGLPRCSLIAVQQNPALEARLARAEQVSTRAGWEHGELRRSQNLYGREHTSTLMVMLTPAADRAEARQPAPASRRSKPTAAIGITHSEAAFFFARRSRHGRSGCGHGLCPLRRAAAGDLGGRGRILRGLILCRLILVNLILLARFAPARWARISATTV